MIKHYDETLYFGSLFSSPLPRQEHTGKEAEAPLFNSCCIEGQISRTGNIEEQSGIRVRKTFTKERSIPPPLTEEKINYCSWQRINDSNLQSCVIIAAAESKTGC